MEKIESEIKLAAMESDIKNITNLLLDIKDELKVFKQTYIPRSEQNEMFKSRDDLIRELKEEIKQIQEDNAKRKDRLPDWIAVFIAFLAVAINFFNK